MTSIDLYGAIKQAEELTSRNQLSQAIAVIDSLVEAGHDTPELHYILAGLNYHAGNLLKSKIHHQRARANAKVPALGFSAFATISVVTNAARRVRKKPSPTTCGGCRYNGGLGKMFGGRCIPCD